MQVKRYKKNIAIILLFLGITGIFFYKTFLKGYVPFPGDLLVAEYQPWRSYSFLGYNPGSYPNKAQYFDVIRQLYPWKELAVDQIKKGEIPLWNPYNFSGSPLLANLQSSVFYPTILLFLLFPMTHAWTISTFLQPFFASLFTYFYLKKLGLKNISSMFGAITYGFCLYMTVFLEYNTLGHVILWLPLLLLSIEHLIENKTIRWTLLYIGSTVCAAFAGHLQLFFLLLVFSHVYLTYRARAEHKSLLPLLFLTILSLSISAIQMLPTWELFLHSARVNQPYDYFIHTLLIQPKQLLRLVAPDIFGNPVTRNYLLSDSYPSKAIYVGIGALIFVLVSVFQRKSHKIIPFFTASGIVLLILLTHSPLTELFYHLPLPIIATSAPTNALFLLSFSLAVLAAVGVDIFLNQKEKNVLPGVIILLSFLVTPIILQKFGIALIPKSIVLPLGILIISGTSLIVSAKRKSLRSYVVVGILIITTLDLLYYFNKFNPFVPKELIYPSTHIAQFLKNEIKNGRFWGYGSANIESNLATQLHLPSPDGYDPLYPRRYGEFIQSSKDGKIGTSFSNQTRSDAVIAPGFGREDFNDNIYRKLLLNLLGTAYILNKDENGTDQTTFPPSTYQQIYSYRGWQVLKNRDALPKVFLTSSYSLAKTKNEFEKIFFDPTHNPRNIILDEAVSQSFSLNAFGTASISEYSPNKITIETETTGSQLLFLSDTYFPGWKATVNNKPASIYRANYAFRSVAVPEGKSMVTFSYQPQSFLYGKLLSFISLLILLFLLISMKIEGRKK